MRVVVVLYGSRGDIQPGLCVALALQERGHEVVVAVPPNLAGFARTVGVVTVLPLGLDTGSAWSSDAASASMRRRNPLARLRFALSTVRAGFAAFDDALVGLLIGESPAAGDPDLLVVGPLCQERGVASAEALGIPVVVLRYGPMSENGTVGAAPGLTDGWSAAWKRRSWRVADRLTWWATGWNENSFRHRIGVPRARGPLPQRLRRNGVLQIQAYDPAIVPTLTDEWGPDKPVVGFLDLPPGARVGLAETRPDDPSLTAWLAAGEAPVFVSFGSMPLTDPDEVIARFAEAGRRGGVRLLMAIGDHRGPDRERPWVHHLGAADHAAVLPLCRAAIHHGGAGTTAATLRAGLPTLVCAVTADQPFWGQRVRDLGVGGSRRLRSITVDEIIGGLRVLLKSETRSAANELAATMVPPEKAVARVAGLIEASLPGE
ncbi:glycosyltransferase [Gordonia soli]|nr:glycosyltransferase [Gordonia soli]